MGLFKKHPNLDISSLPPAPSGPDASTDLPIWPSGIARFSDGILEVTTGGGLRVARRDIIELGVKPPRAGRLSLRINHRAGLEKRTYGYWVEERHAAALRGLVERINAHPDAA